MKKSLIVLLSLVLAACGSFSPAATQTPIIIVVTATPGPAEVAPILIPTDTPAEEAATEAQPTVAEAPTDTPIPPTNPPAESGAVFINITRSGDQLYLQCPPAEIIFAVTSLDPNITDVDLWYRMLDKSSGSYSDWLFGKRMSTTDNTNFTLIFSGMDIKQNVRFKQAWLEYQFIGMNNYGNVVARSDKYEQQITFTLSCP